MKQMIALLCVVVFSACSNTKEMKFLQLNIWQEGTMVEGGYDALVNELVRADADFVMLSEVRNYKGTRFCDRIITSLAEKGLTYYSFYSFDSGLLSKYPIQDSVTIFPLKDDHGTVYKLKADVNGKTFCVYTTHLDYQDCSYYEVRGYSGKTWAKLPEPVTNVDTLLARNVASLRDDAIKLFIADANKEAAAGNYVIIGGDFNEPSHLDWTEATKDSADHHGVVIPWTVTTLLEENNYKDAYRVMYPNPVTHPGYTYPADCKGAPIKRLTWAPESDERERIDLIFYYPSEGMKLKDAAIYGPKGCIRNSERVQETSEDKFIEPIDIWPTDHKGVLTVFEVSF
ncbi:endonuclease/exonuclease/phosphatase family protein [Bacteroides sp. 519]|uniref:endonuclease/exonuclease/phosphatase family protein n=1 Tax=Bacteroides sp. 519 TaxID=2302937 RepID=UPI0013D3BE80|nr:endonuclease/exonuclease/phosphatase family protein [Bacteroides sp. 519]NDV57404.1 endonuclease/exonuclease/phosphatase family protein [Bacteroides sp. 519]